MKTSGNPPLTSAMPFAVRALTAADVLQVQEIEREAFPGHFPPTPFQHGIRDRSASHLVACRVPGKRLDASWRPSTGGRARSGSGPARLAATIRNAAAGPRTCLQSAG